MASGSENTRQHMERTNRDASLAHAIVHAAESYIAQDLDALAARVAKLEERTESVGSAAGSTGKRPVCEANEPRLSCAPLDSLVERMAEAMWVLRHRTVAWSMAEYAEKEEYRKDARAALRVAAEGLLGDVTSAEFESFTRMTRAQEGAANCFLRARLAAALEACRG